ncbi:hypothetical protein R3Q06_30270 [Rhodococcus erythropolis]|uniref:hypothetical protein n=1 Tax=Rhodococcus erythropolis TaxID=1833 RepID=UPI00294906AA|nr:hypothetical protein [Rhodococcus erythropolis]MDV6277784.1 hypothetical protein [Rhodococcus erythropolis]
MSTHASTQQKKSRWIDGAPPVAAWKALGLHILIPIALAAGMALAYLGAFHQPSPHDVPVAIVGNNAQSQVFAQTVQQKSDGALRVTTMGTEDAARQALSGRDITAAYMPGPGSATLLIASAASDTTATVMRTVFGDIAYQQNLPLRVVDVVPVGEHDTTGQGLFFLLVALSVGSYSSAIALSAVAGSIGVGWRFVVGAGAAVLISAIAVIVAGPVYGVFSGHYAQVFGLSALYSLGIILIGLGLHPILGKWTTVALTGLFVMLNFTSSGGIFAPELQPGFFGGLHSFWNGAAWLHASQTQIYFPGQTVTGSIGTLLLWLVPGVFLILLTHRWSICRTRVANELKTVSEEELVAV